MWNIHFGNSTFFDQKNLIIENEILLDSNSLYKKLGKKKELN